MMNMRNEITLYQEALIRYYNYITDSDVSMLNEIPEDKILFLSSFSREELCRPFIISCIQQDMSIKQVSIRYGISVHVIRGIGRNQYLYSPRRSGHMNTK
jgi:hypothetical protein